MLDLTRDLLAEASLSAEQRRIWCDIRAELQDARQKIQDLETRLAELEGSSDEGRVVLTRPDFNREVSRMLAFDERYGGASSIIYFDLENISEIADKHGKSTANAIIRNACDALVRGVRGSDIVGRLDADELGVFLARCENAQAWKKAEELAASLMETMTGVHGCLIEPLISFGAYTFGNREDLATGMKCAAQSVTRSGNTHNT